MEIIEERWPSINSFQHVNCVGVDIVAFENPPSVKTIPEIAHYHIIVRSEGMSSSPPSRTFPPDIVECFDFLIK